MEKLITSKEAKNLVLKSEQRKDELIKLVNASIIERAESGDEWAHMPTIASETEIEWLEEELILNGFKVIDGHPAIRW